MRGQGFFIRGFAYFDLARLYAGIPNEVGTMGVAIVTKPTTNISESNYPKRSSMDATYTQVKNDLEKALTLLPESYGDANTDRKRVTKATARALLSRYHLYLKDYQQAADYATKVINDTRFELVDNYSSIFNNDFTKESIFELDFSVSDGNGHANWYIPAALGGRGDLAAHTEFRNEVASRPNDERNLFKYEPLQKAWYPTKYNKANNSNNQHIIRIAEMYLNRAEARANIGKLKGTNSAIRDLNRIRNRAGLSDTTGTGLDTKSELIEAILKERKIELCFEGHRWFDLVRTGRAMQVLNSVPRTNSPGSPASLTEPGRQIFPIPQNEIDTNPKIDQNEAYN
jgi:tetratricopeptide (TPR) repeat protein